MEIEKTKGYGIALSDLEGNWDKDFKKKLKKTAQDVIFDHLNFRQKLKLGYYYFRLIKRAQKLDLSDIYSRGMTNDSFLHQQLEYLVIYSALTCVLDQEKAQQIMFKVMEETAVEAFFKSSPEEDDIKSYGDSFEFFRKYTAPLPVACCKAGCLDMELTVNEKNCFQYDIKWCVWLELANKMGVPEACIPNCYADDYAYPDYFKKYGIKYSRKGTLAKGAKSCDLRFERMA